MSVTSIITRRAVFKTVGAAPYLKASAPGLLLTQRRQVIVYESSSDQGLTFAPYRFASTQPLTPADNLVILNEQRKHRPTSPHLAIYRKQLTATLSALNRITGVALSGALYGASIIYLLHPYVSFIDSAHLIQFVSDLPAYVKYSAKALLASAFTFHTYNGLRHLSWDVGKGLTLKGVYATGYAVLGATAVSTAYLTFFA
ncbi:succinate dehydrogenase (ubiquinone) cytochrome b560 subunit, partial [Tremellales sp. Uapishka_1]